MGRPLGRRPEPGLRVVPGPALGNPPAMARPPADVVRKRSSLPAGDPTAPVELRRFGAGPGPGRRSRDRVAVEEPLEIRLGDAPLAVVMRTPGHDGELARGLLFAEGVIGGEDDLFAVRACSFEGPEGAPPGVVRVQVRPDRLPDPARLRRNLVATSACGVCGKETLENLAERLEPLPPEAGPRVTADWLRALPARLEAAQPAFASTGGLHAAALFDAGGRARVVREDVGRHNAVDKVVGHAVAERALPLRELVLLVSGRISFEIVQKALAAGVTVLAGISAPTSLAVLLAERFGMTLVGFLREGGFNVYGSPHRVRGRIGPAGGSGP